jgi:hypothetical protein
MKKILSICAVLLVAATAMGQNRYGIKSGSYKTEMDMMGQTITNTTYFDDYGAKEVTEMEMMGMQMTQITKDGVTYIVNKGDKSVQETPRPRPDQLPEPDGRNRRQVQGQGNRQGNRLRQRVHHLHG